MRIRFCPECGKAGLKWNDPEGKGYDGLTDAERYRSGAVTDWSMRYCPRCKEWVKPDISGNYDQHKRR